MSDKFFKQIVIVLVMIVVSGYWSGSVFGENADAILEKIDGYRDVGDSFSMNIKISDFENDKLNEEATFSGYFSGNDKSLLICTNGKNKGMKVLMKGDDMWVNLTGSKRGLRITPVQRLMGQAANGDVAKVSFSQDYTGTLLKTENEMVVLELKAKSKGATYQKAILYAEAKSFKPVKAEFFLTSGKHFKTAYYMEFKMIEGRNTVSKVKIEDKMNPKLYTIMENSGFKNKNIPEKYFNVMFLPNIEKEL